MSRGITVVVGSPVRGTVSGIRGSTMNSRWKAVAAATLLLTVGGCAHRVPPDTLAVGTCILSDDQGHRSVPCDKPHTHKVIAIVPRAEECPSTTDMFATPADPDDGLTTTCFQSHWATE